jgi:pyruvate dehydrogenase E2 component (dihydrolipoamide acetyltransferase)
MDWIIGLPALGHTAEGGTVREWLKAVGDPVTRSEPIVVVESDKVSLEIEAPGTGILLEIAVPVGTEVPTGTVLGRIGEPGIQPAAKAGAAASKAANGPPVPMAAAPAAAPVVAPPKPARPMATPLARRLARDAGIDFGAVTGRGKYGQIRKADVLEAIERDKATTAAAAPSPVRETAAGASSAPVAPAGLSVMRKAISRRMVEAWRNQPMVTLSRTIDVTSLTEWRARLSKPATLTSVLAAAMARTLVVHPRLNGTIDADGLRSGGPVNLAVAVALDDGLAAPVVKSAHLKSLAVIDGELASLIHLARSGRLQPDDLADATVSLSNLGSLGIQTFTPILTPPQIAVLGVGAIDRVLRETPGGFAFRSLLNVSLTIDHRAVDGADGARFLQSLAEAVQSPEQLLLPAAA